MKRFKNHLIAAAVLSVLATIGTIMNSHQAAGHSIPPLDAVVEPIGGSTHGET